MGVMYRLMYAVGFAPWDTAAPDELRELIEGPNALKAGRALDLGSGMGNKSIYLASHGWDVTGVETVPKALKESRRRAEASGVKVDFRSGDVTRLNELGLEAGYTLCFDFGCYHGLKAAERTRYAEGVTALAAPGAVLLMMAFTKALPPVPSGVSESELRERFGPAWELAGSHPVEQAGTRAMMRASASWFRLDKC
jgi:SAM-dependent methyltransferase